MQCRTATVPGSRGQKKTSPRSATRTGTAYRRRGSGPPPRDGPRRCAGTGNPERRRRRLQGHSNLNSRALRSSAPTNLLSLARTHTCAPADRSRDCCRGMNAAPVGGLPLPVARGPRPLSLARSAASAGLAPSPSGALGVRETGGRARPRVRKHCLLSAPTLTTWSARPSLPRAPLFLLGVPAQGGGEPQERAAERESAPPAPSPPLPPVA